MKKISKKIKYDFTIYICLLLALVLIGYSSYSYLDTNSYSLKEILSKEEQPVAEKEPVELQQVDKKDLLKKYFLNIQDEIIQDQLLTGETIRTWNEYEILNITYDRKISNNYHTYIADIKINNLNVNLPALNNKELSTKEYLVISFNINILKDEVTNEYYIKSTDIPKNH